MPPPTHLASCLLQGLREPPHRVQRLLPHLRVGGGAQRGPVRPRLQHLWRKMVLVGRCGCAGEFGWVGRVVCVCVCTIGEGVSGRSKDQPQRPPRVHWLQSAFAHAPYMGHVAPLWCVHHPLSSSK